MDALARVRFFPAYRTKLAQRWGYQRNRFLLTHRQRFQTVKFAENMPTLAHMLSLLAHPCRRLTLPDSILDRVLFQEGRGNRRRHTPYQRVIEKLRAFHRKAVTVEFEMVNIEVLRKNQLSYQTRKTIVFIVIEERLLDIEREPAVGSD